MELNNRSKIGTKYHWMSILCFVFITSIVLPSCGEETRSSDTPHEDTSGMDMPKEDTSESDMVESDLFEDETIEDETIEDDVPSEEKTYIEVSMEIVDENSIMNCMDICAESSLECDGLYSYILENIAGIAQYEMDISVSLPKCDDIYDYERQDVFSGQIVKVKEIKCYCLE